ncbi:hypothetical protein DFH29DRAFT_1075991 [Suillus ampliporus]|nr:hypothetical protein DFH29DRAFT_1075991 [Suillus ampliporus]
MSNVADAEQDHPVFWVHFRLASSELPHSDSVCASLECRHVFDAPGNYQFFLAAMGIIGGKDIQRAQVPFTATNSSAEPKQYPLCQPAGTQLSSYYHLVDEQTFAVMWSGFITLYTLQELDGSPQRRITYVLPKFRYSSSPEYVVHATPSFQFHCAAARPDLMPDYVPSLESQIMVLEVFPDAWPIILVINMTIFTGGALHSETHVEIPWPDWGPRHTCCFPHHRSYRISMFGSKMVYALPRDRISEPGQSQKGLSTKFYVHILDFNTRVIARLENSSKSESPDLLVRKPERLTRFCSCFDRSFISNHLYTATVCRVPFTTMNNPYFRDFFLQQNRLTFTWSRPGATDLRVVSLVHVEVDSDLTD